MARTAAPAGRAPARRLPAGPAAQQLPPRTASWGREATACVASGVAAFGAAPLLEHPSLAVPGLGLGVLGGAARALHGRREQARGALADRVAEALAPLLGLRSPDRRTVSLRWRRGRNGVPRRVDLRYAPGVDDSDPLWLPEVLQAVERRLQSGYAVRTHDRRRCRLQLVPAAPDVAGEPVPALRVRAERTVLELLGPTAAVTGVQWDGEDLVGLDVRHEAGAKLSASGYRHRVERVVSTLLPGRWRAHWDLEADTVRFEVRPAFPSSVWLPVDQVDPHADLLAAYDDLEVDYGVDEDGAVLRWRLTQDPHVMLVGSTGSGKSLALDTPVPTPSGWTTMGELVDGDTVYDEQGQSCTVVRAHPVRHDRPCYRMTFSDGSEVVADAEHLWSTSTRDERVSRQRHDKLRRHDERRQRMTSQQLATLTGAIDRCATGEEVSIPAAARLAGLSPAAAVLRRLRVEVPASSAAPRPISDFTYARQAVEQVQTVSTYPRRELLEQLAGAVAIGRVALPGWTPTTLGALAGEADEVISSPQLRALLEVDYVVLQRVLRAVDVPVGQRRESVMRQVPASVVRRRAPGRPVHVHPKQQLLEALVAWGSGRVRDGKPRIATSGIRTTAQIAATLRTGSGHANHSVPITQPVVGQEQVLPLAPYALGVWLGDGSSWEGEFTSADPDIARHLQDEGIDVHDRGHPAGKPVGYRARTYLMRSPVRRQLDELGLLRGADPARRGRTKHVPPQYLRASVQQRRALLAGLMDTDGTVSPQGACQFTNTTEHLAVDVHELACSLGFRATLQLGRATLNGRDCGPKWTVSWTTTERVFRLERKHQVHQERTTRSAPERLQQRYIVSVEPVESVPVRCITVDSPSRLYLVGRSFIPTHNTVTAHTLLVQLTRRGVPVWIVDGKGVEFLGFQDWPNVQVVATSIEEQVAVIHRAWELMEYRYELVTSGRARESDFEPLVLFLDEFADFRGNLLDWYGAVKVKGDPTKPAVLGKNASLARKARTARIHLVFGTQRPDAEFFGSGEMRDNFRLRISMGRLSPQGAQMMWESPAIGTSVPKGCRGRATTINDANRPVEIQTYRTPDPRKVTEGSEEAQLLARLRPSTVVHDRLLVVPPYGEADLDTGDVKDPTYSEYAGASWVRASQRPDLDPVRKRREEAVDGRALSSTLAVFGLLEPDELEQAAAGGKPVGLRKATAGETPAEPAAAAPAPAAAAPVRLRVVPDPDRSDVDDDLADVQEHVVVEDYGPAAQRPVSELVVGDLVLVDEDLGLWGVIDQDVEPDLADPGCLAVSWRSDDDDCGLLSVPDDQVLLARGPIELDDPE